MRGLVLIGMLGLGIVHAQTQAPTPSSQQDALGTAFRSACWSGDLNKVTLLFNEGAPLEGCDNLGRTPLFLASHGDPDVVRFLLAHGAKIDAAENDGDLPFAHACEFGDLASAQMLLDAGSDINHANKYGRTALMLAARSGHDDLISLLISHHADINFGVTAPPALYFAVWQDHVNIANMLLDAGAHVTRPTDAHDPEWNPPTLMGLAARTGDLSLIDLLLDHGGQVNERNRLGISALLHMAYSGNDPFIIEYLIEKGADPNLPDNDGVTPLMAAAKNQPVRTIRYLLEHGAKLEARDKKGRTALMHAASIIADQEVAELIKQKADVNAADNDGETALTYGGDRGDTRVMDMLKEAGATRTNIHIIAKPQADPPLSKSQIWALGVGDLFAQANGDSPYMLQEHHLEQRAQAAFVRYWNVRSHDGVLNTIELLERDPSFPDLLASQAQDSLSFPDTESKMVRAFQLLFLDAYWREKTNRAFRLGRASNVVRMGVDAGYLTEDEAWPILMRIARETQSEFYSWREFSDNFLDGREIGANTRSGNFRACARLLLNPQEPNSPWNQLPWNTDLSGN